MQQYQPGLYLSSPETPAVTPYVAMMEHAALLSPTTQYLAGIDSTNQGCGFLNCTADLRRVGGHLSMGITSPGSEVYHLHPEQPSTSAARSQDSFRGFPAPSLVPGHMDGGTGGQTGVWRPQVRYGARQVTEPWRPLLRRPSEATTSHAPWQRSGRTHVSYSGVSGSGAGVWNAENRRGDGGSDDRSAVARLRAKKIVPLTTGPRGKMGIMIRSLPGTALADYVIALADVVGGGENITHATRLSYGRICVYFRDENTLNDFMLSHGGLILNDQFVPAVRMTQRVEKLVVSNIPPEFPPSDLEEILSQIGRVVSPVTPLAIRIKRPDLTHVLSWRRQCFVVRREEVQVPESLLVDFGTGKHRIYFSFGGLKCYRCSGPHPIIACTGNLVDESTSRESTSAEESGEAGVPHDVTDSASSPTPEDSSDSSYCAATSNHLTPTPTTTSTHQSPTEWSSPGHSPGGISPFNATESRELPPDSARPGTKNIAVFQKSDDRDPKASATAIDNAEEHRIDTTPAGEEGDVLPSGTEMQSEEASGPASKTKRKNSGEVRASGDSPRRKKGTAEESRRGRKLTEAEAYEEIESLCREGKVSVTLPPKDIIRFLQVVKGQMDSVEIAKAFFPDRAQLICALKELVGKRAVGAPCLDLRIRRLIRTLAAAGGRAE